MSIEKFKLNRTVQCAKCPWKVSTNPHDIPGGYSENLHENLEETIAKGSCDFRQKKVMACHHSEPGKEDYCVGYLHNQLGIGNNIGLRIKFLRCENIGDIEIVGRQHQTFEETLPRNKKRKRIRA